MVLFMVMILDGCNENTCEQHGIFFEEVSTSHNSSHPDEVLSIKEKMIFLV